MMNQAIAKDMISNAAVELFTRFFKDNEQIVERIWDRPSLYQYIDREMMYVYGYNIPQRIVFYAFLCGMSFDFSLYNGEKILEDIHYPTREEVEQNFDKLWAYNRDLSKLKSHVMIRTYQAVGPYYDYDEWVDGKIFPFR